MTLVVKPAARNDILRQMAYFAEQGGEALGRRFIDAVEYSFARLAEQPNSGSQRIFSNPDLAGLRSWAINDFETIRAYYLVAAGTITILRVLHGRRDIAGVLGEH